MMFLVLFFCQNVHAMDAEQEVNLLYPGLGVDQPECYDDPTYPRSPRGEARPHLSKKNLKYRYYEALYEFQERHFGAFADPHYFKGRPGRAKTSLSGIRLLDEANHPAAARLRAKIALQGGLFDEAIQALDEHDQKLKGTDRWIRAELVRAKYLKASNSPLEIETLVRSLEAQDVPRHVIGRDLSTLGHCLLHGDRYFKRSPQVQLSKIVLEKASAYGSAFATLQLHSCFDESGAFKGQERAQEALEESIAFKMNADS